MGVSLLTAHLFDKRIRVSNACNTDFRLFMVLGEEMLRLRDRYSLFKIIFGGVIIVLANKSITTRSPTLLSVTVII